MIWHLPTVLGPMLPKGLLTVAHFLHALETNQNSQKIKIVNILELDDKYIYTRSVTHEQRLEALNIWIIMDEILRMRWGAWHN